MSVELVDCPDCGGNGWEWWEFSNVPFKGCSAPCWTCDGTGRVPSPVSIGWDLGQEILDARARHGKQAA